MRIHCRVPLWPAWLILMSLAGCHDHPNADMDPGARLAAAQVQVSPVRSVSQPLREELPGTVEPRLSAILETKVSGRILNLPVSAGQRVQEGQLLAELEDTEFQARLESAQAAAKRASGDLARYEELHRRQAATQAEYDAFEAAATIAQARVRELETQLASTRVQAPFHGVIAAKLAEVGDLASPGKALLLLESTESHRFKAAIPESLIDGLREGQTCQILLETLSEPTLGVIEEISPAGDPASRTWDVKFALPETSSLRSGLFGRVSISAGDQTLLLIPRRSVIRRGQLEFVYVVQDQHARLRLIKTGRWHPETVEVLAGLSIDEVIVASDPTALADGQPVNVR